MRERPFVWMFLMTLVGNMVSKADKKFWALFVFSYFLIFWLLKSKRHLMILFAMAMLGNVLGLCSSCAYGIWWDRNLNYVKQSIEENIPTYIEGIATEVVETEKYRSIHLSSCRMITQDESWSSPDYIIFQWIKQNNKSEKEAIFPGDYVWGEGVLSLPSLQRNDGGYNEALYQYGKGVIGKINVEKCGKQEIFIQNKGFYTLMLRMKQVCIRIPQGIRTRISEKYHHQLKERNAGILDAICLGIKRDLDRETKMEFTMAGIAHILAISGVHISIVGMTVFAGLRKTGRGVCFSAATAISAAAFFVGMTGNSISGMRALFMFIITLVAVCLGRPYDGINSIALAGSVMLWWKPYFIFSTSFQYSFVAVSAIYVGKAMLCRCYRRLHPTITACFMSSYLSLWLLPITAWYSGQIATVSFLLNLLVIPLVSPVLILGLLGGVLGVVSCNFISQGCLGLADKGVGLLCFLAKSYRRLSYGSLVIGKPSISVVVIYVGMLLICSILGYQRRNIKMLLLIVPSVVLIVNANGQFRNQVTFLDVGQGDGVYLETMDGKSIMIDGGSSSEYEIGKNLIQTYLNYHGRNHIDYWFVSHCDEDHISGLMELLESGYPIKHLFFAKSAKKHPTCEKLCRLAKENRTKVIFVHNEMKIQTQSFLIMIFGNDSNKKEKEFVSTKENVNDESLVLLMEYCRTGHCYLFAGDIGFNKEKEMLARLKKYVFSGVYVLKANHHGSKYSNGEEWLEFLKPRNIVVSYGVDNRYGHPHEEAIERMKSVGAAIFFTGKGGQITITE